MPDRFERMVEQNFKACACVHCDGSRKISLTLLRRQHAAVVRLVNRETLGLIRSKIYEADKEPLRILHKSILAALAQWKRGAK